MSFRIALLGIYHESNTFVPQATVTADFMNGYYLRGNAIRKEYETAHNEIGGMMEVMDREGMEIVPILYASATPGGTISANTYNDLLTNMMEELEKILPVDACLVIPHGAGVSEEFPDMDGHWLSLVRKKLGDSIPIFGTLDLHANVSPLMVSSTNALVAYKQNPHVDMRQRGIEAANLLVQFLRGKTNPVQVLIQLPLAISIEQQLTDHEPCKSLYAYADELSRDPEILSLSILHGFPYADVEEMGASIIVVANGNRDKALETAKKLEKYILNRRESFVGHKNDIPSALNMIETSEKPVLLLDMGDNVGGGGPANNCCILEAFEERKKYKYFVCIYDPDAVRMAENHQPGETFKLIIVGTGNDGIRTCRLKVKLLRITNGEFQETNPRHGGQVNFKMGRTAVVATEEGSVIMLTSLRVMPFSLQQLISQGVQPSEFDAIVAKGVNAPIAAYASVCPTVIQVNTPGVTQADMTLFRYENRRKPLFPFEK
ncbi:M81 family metallopeptidase [Daejeonella sp.]|uniref:M81 family metallopeptidase n=1 Tax=Daejeonella sp. TaxID=2805397 RepID=UPI0030C56A7B